MRRIHTVRAALLGCVAIASSLTLTPPAAADGNDTFQTAIVFLQEMSTERAVTLYERVIGVIGGATIVVGRDKRSVIVKDTRERLTRYRHLLSLLDVKGQDKLRIFVRPVIYRVPSELAKMLDETLAKVSKAPLHMAPDDRAGLLVVATTRETYRRLHILAERLDVRPDRGKQVRVVPDHSW